MMQHPMTVQELVNAAELKRIIEGLPLETSAVAAVEWRLGQLEPSQFAALLTELARDNHAFRYDAASAEKSHACTLGNMHSTWLTIMPMFVCYPYLKGLPDVGCSAASLLVMSAACVAMSRTLCPIGGVSWHAD